MGDGEEHHGAPSVQPGGHQCTTGAPGNHGHQAAGTLPLPVRLYHHLDYALREAIVQKITEFYEIISQTGGGVNRISYLLFRNVKAKITHYQTIHFYSYKGSFPHILGVYCTKIIINLNFGWLW